ncbi:flagellar protein FlgN [Bacillus sp. CGMCC 1.16541]|uniref:flagellar protein FlgN n=1 Tax=Bacillus sp. CGMCC 1.16541 TaxID=2185143 RepID=UPI001EF44EE6|nr:flagellar protein FlgN [Bacillus sp. CGMCC 1.16541]
MQTLISLLTKLLTLHQSLHQLAERKTEIVKEGNLEALNTLMNEEHVHITAIAKVEEARNEAVIRLLSGQTIQGNSPTLQDVINHANEEEGKQLTHLQTELISCLTHLKKRNELNQQLIYQSLQFVNVTMDLVRPQAKSYNYERPTQLTQPTPTAYFHSKA